jgi:hypothetical protein
LRMILSENRSHFSGSCSQLARIPIGWNQDAPDFLLSARSCQKTACIPRDRALAAPLALPSRALGKLFAASRSRRFAGSSPAAGASPPRLPRDLGEPLPDRAPSLEGFRQPIPLIGDGHPVFGGLCGARVPDSEHPASRGPPPHVVRTHNLPPSSRARGRAVPGIATCE